jgi:hypothetical protein
VAIGDSKTYTLPSGPVKDGTMVDKDLDDLASDVENDPRMTNARVASDVYAWAKGATKPAYTYTEVGAAAASHKHALTDLDNQAAETILVNATDSPAAPTALAVAASTLVGRKATGAIVALTKGEAQTVLNVGDGANVVGPASAYNNALAWFSGTTGKLLYGGNHVGITDADIVENTITGYKIEHGTLTSELFHSSIKFISAVYLDHDLGPISFGDTPTTILTHTIATNGHYFIVLAKSQLYASPASADSGELRFSLWVDGNEYDTSSARCYPQDFAVAEGKDHVHMNFVTTLTAMWYGQVASGNKVFKTTMQYSASAVNNQMIIVELGY